LQYNYTGWVVGVDKTTAEVKTVFITESGSFAAPEDGTFNGGGGGAGIWQSGMGFSSDNPNRMFFVTGNGLGHENKELPASGRSPLGTLDECIVNVRINQTTGKVSLQDYFEPYEYISLDAGDLDLGSSGLTLLDPATFSGGSVSRMGVTVGKNGKAYVVNLDNLGGFKQGSANGDAVIQTITMPGGGSIFGGVGSYPLEGGEYANGS
jgi:iron transport multicopper oxidase